MSDKQYVFYLGSVTFQRESEFWKAVKERGMRRGDVVWYPDTDELKRNRPGSGRLSAEIAKVGGRRDGVPHTYTLRRELWEIRHKAQQAP